jgi:hypothetical protein
MDYMPIADVSSECHPHVNVDPGPYAFFVFGVFNKFGFPTVLIGSYLNFDSRF